MLQPVLKYLISSPLTEDPFELDQLFQTILDRRVAILVAPASTVPLAFMAVQFTESLWPIVWIAVDLLLTAARWTIMVNSEGASDATRRRNSEALVYLGILWVSLLAIAVYLCLASGQVTLMVVAAVIGTGVACTITSRNAAMPRHALLLLVLLGGPFALGLLMSPIDGMLVPALLTSVWIASLYLFVLQNHASMLRLIKAERSARRAAETDELTGLYNRAHFSEKRAQLDAAPQGGAGYGFLCIDLDGFKRVNDQYGHSIGDRLLTQVAARMRENLRRNDTLYRVGGDEFVALLPDACPEDCSAVAERMIAALTEPFTVSEGTVVRIGTSIGSACSQGEKTTSAALLHAADAAMYTAKALGKGRHVPA